MKFRFGFDIGRVLIDHDTDMAFYGDDFLTAPAMPGAFTTIRNIIELIEAKNTFIISKVKDPYKSEEWLKHHRFCEKTGFLWENLRFCTEREAKGPIARNETGDPTIDLQGGALTHFADDRADVLLHMDGLRVRYLFGEQPSEQPNDISAFVPMLTWDDLWINFSSEWYASL